MKIATSLHSSPRTRGCLLWWSETAVCSPSGKPGSSNQTSGTSNPRHEKGSNGGGEMKTRNDPQGCTVYSSTPTRPFAPAPDPHFPKSSPTEEGVFKAPQSSAGDKAIAQKRPQTLGDQIPHPRPHLVLGLSPATAAVVGRAAGDSRAHSGLGFPCSSGAGLRCWSGDSSCW